MNVGITEQGDVVRLWFVRVNGSTTCGKRGRASDCGAAQPQTMKWRNNNQRIARVKFLK